MLEPKIKDLNLEHELKLRMEDKPDECRGKSTETKSLKVVNFYDANPLIEKAEEE